MATLRVNGIKHELSEAFDSSLQALQVIWDEIGIDNSQRQERVEAVAQHLNRLLTEMVKEEEAMKGRLLANVEKYGHDVIRLSKELQMPAAEPPEGLSILELEKELRTSVDKLARERHYRIKSLKRLKEMDQELCNALYSTPYYIPTGTVPSRQKLEELEQHVKVLEEEKAKRQATYKQCKKDIVVLMEELDKCPNNSFQRDILSGNDESFVFSPENMNALKSLQTELETEHKENFKQASLLREKIDQLWERLQVPEAERTSFSTAHTGFRPPTIVALQEELNRCQLLKHENLEQVIRKTKEELVSWWDKCYYSKEQRNNFTYFHDEGVTDEVLELVEAEVEKVKKYYEDNKEMLDKVARRQVLFYEYLEYERKANDPSRYYQRGAALLKEEKARKKITKELPKVEAEVKADIEKWESDNDCQFLVGGVRFVEFIDQQWKEYNQAKEDEKNQRRQAKARQLQEEAYHGTTPGKRRILNGTTPGKTPTKLRRMGESVTPGSSRLGMTRNHTASLMPSPAVRSIKTPRSKLAGDRTMKARKALGEKNEILSETAILAQPLASTDHNSIASVGHYTDFAFGLNQQDRENHRSSMMPKPQAFF